MEHGNILDAIVDIFKPHEDNFEHVSASAMDAKIDDALAYIKKEEKGEQSMGGDDDGEMYTVSSEVSYNTAKLHASALAFVIRKMAESKSDKAKVREINDYIFKTPYGN